MSRIRNKKYPSTETCLKLRERVLEWLLWARFYCFNKFQPLHWWPKFVKSYRKNTGMQSSDFLPWYRRTSFCPGNATLLDVFQRFDYYWKPWQQVLYPVFPGIWLFYDNYGNYFRYQLLLLLKCYRKNKRILEPGKLSV